MDLPTAGTEPAGDGGDGIASEMPKTRPPKALYRMSEADAVKLFEEAHNLSASKTLAEMMGLPYPGAADRHAMLVDMWLLNVLHCKETGCTPREAAAFFNVMNEVTTAALASAPDSTTEESFTLFKQLMTAAALGEPFPAVAAAAGSAGDAETALQDGIGAATAGASAASAPTATAVPALARGDAAMAGAAGAKGGPMTRTAIDDGESGPLFSTRKIAELSQFAARSFYRNFKAYRLWWRRLPPEPKAAPDPAADGGDTQASLESPPLLEGGSGGDDGAAAAFA